MSQNLPPAGTYPANLTGQIVIYLAGTGALCAALPVQLGSGEWPWSGKHTMVLVKSDGTLMTNNNDTLKEVFGWDGIDPFWLMYEDPENPDAGPRDLTLVLFSVVGEHEEYTPDGGEPRMSFKIKWLNSANRGSKMPEAADRKSILAKFGAKFRAVASVSKPAPAPVKPAEAKPAETVKPASGPAAKKKSAPPVSKPAATAGGLAPTATMEEAWDAMVKKNQGKSEDELGEQWYALMEKLFPGKEASDLSIQNWGALKVEIEK